MKHVLLGITCIICFAFSKGQTAGSIIANQAAQGVREGATITTEAAGQKLTNKLIGKLFNKKKKDNTRAQVTNSTTTTATNTTNATPQSSLNTASSSKDNVNITQTTSVNSAAATTNFQTYSKFDFIPGAKVIALDDFSTSSVGDFPVTWNTNSAGEIVTSSTRGGHWLMINKTGKFFPEYIKNLPDNFTFECDLVTNPDFNGYSSALKIGFLSGKGGNDLFDNWYMVDGKRSGVKISVHPTDGQSGSESTIETFDEGKSVIRNQINTHQFANQDGKQDFHLHISVWRQKQRIRVYLNEQKVYDLPRAFPADKNYTVLLFELENDMKNNDRYLIGNIKLSVGDPDMRNKLITEGKFVTRGILFDVNSDQIKPESYGVLKSIAEVLTENPGVKVRIVGHTDSDGSDATNLALSKKRAESVKASLISDFGIDASRMQTDGKGSSQPVDSNTTAEGKANNRRVEFIKL
ncbi:MAG: OmpA family protein [Bacteroidota bacterium]|nr:OmpA family protein [Bacteroidota bacterium]